MDQNPCLVCETSGDACAMCPENSANHDQPNKLIEKLSEQVHNARWEEKKKQGFHAPVECATNVCIIAIHALEVGKDRS
jgi:hypothetical protein